MEKKDFQRFFKKSFLFSLPLLVLAVGYFYIELFVLPIDFYYERTLDAMVVRHLSAYLPSHFYPNVHLTARLQGGDMGVGTPRAIPQKFDIQTDEFGYRNTPEKSMPPDIVIAGDSFTEIGGPNQSDILSEVMGSRLHEKIYTYTDYSPNALNRFLGEKRFRDHPPPIVIALFVERNLAFLPRPADVPAPEKLVSRMLESSRFKDTLQTILVDLDRLLKAPGWRFFYQKIHGYDPPQPVPSEPGGPFLFYQGDWAPKDASDSEISRIADNILDYQTALSRRGIRMIFVPVPNKESVYYRFLQNKQRPVYLGKIVKALKKRKVETLDLQVEYEKFAKVKRVSLYIFDDSHWNKEGIKLAADRIVPIIKRAQGQKKY